MDKKRIFIGVDVSKSTIDFTALIEGEAIHRVAKNTVKSIGAYLKRIKNELDIEEDSMHIGVENTGRYSWPALNAFGSTKVHLYLLSPLHLKKSMGMVRGKNDAIDSNRIASFMSKNVDELHPYTPPREIIEQLSLLLARRNKLQRLIKAESQTKEEMSCVGSSAIKKFILDESKKTTGLLKKQIVAVEKQLDGLIKNDDELMRKVTLMMSVPGVGKVLSWYLLVKTNEFKNFDDPRKLACFAGVAPFEYSSGTSVRGRTRVSFYADKLLKKILHMAALRVIQLDGELQQFYLRKVGEGKNKMAVINALRNKIIHRVMAVINQNRPYEKNYNKHLVLS
jgi:transposase